MTKVYIVLGEDAKHIHSVLSEDKVPTCFQYPTKYRGANHENVLSEDSEQVIPRSRSCRDPTIFLHTSPHYSE